MAVPVITCMYIAGYPSESICKHETSHDFIVHSAMPRSILPFQYLQWLAFVGLVFTLLDD